eukprot:gene18524-22081_t
MHKRGIIQKVGDNLFYLKKSANVSFEKIALATDISLSHVRNACSGEANITIAYLEKFAAFFGVAEADLVSETKNFPSKESLQKNIQKVRSNHIGGKLPPKFVSKTTSLCISD